MYVFFNNAKFVGVDFEKIMLMKKLFLFSFLAVIFSTSCNKTEEMLPAVDSKETAVIPTSANRTISEAVVLAEKGLEAFGLDSKTRGVARRIDFSNIHYKIDRTTRSGAADTLLYILNFADDQGFALIAANRGAEGVIALAESGSYDGNPTGNVGFDMYMDDTYQYLLSGITPTLIPIPDSERIAFGYRPPFVLEETTVEPMTIVRWDQDAPFNIFCSTPYDERVPSGCVATAIATAMSAYSYPETINLTYPGRDKSSVNLDWLSMKTHYWQYCELWEQCFTCETCRQIGYLSREIGKRVDMDYQIKVSSAGNQVMATCLRSFGYITDDFRKPYNNATVCNSLENGGIVIVRGESPQGGHAWVIDGCKYKKTREEIYIMYADRPFSTWTLDTFLERSVWHVHFNYGWGGDNSIWVLSAEYVFGQGSQLCGGDRDDWPRTVFTDAEGCHNDVGFIPNIKPNI